jgi:hypothetical protein
MVAEHKIVLTNKAIVDLSVRHGVDRYRKLTG